MTSAAETPPAAAAAVTAATLQPPPQQSAGADGLPAPSTQPSSSPPAGDGTETPDSPHRELPRAPASELRPGWSNDRTSLEAVKLETACVCADICRTETDSTRRTESRGAERFSSLCSGPRTTALPGTAMSSSYSSTSFLTVPGRPRGASLSGPLPSAAGQQAPLVRERPPTRTRSSSAASTSSRMSSRSGSSVTSPRPSWKSGAPPRPVYSPYHDVAASPKPRTAGPQQPAAARGTTGTSQSRERGTLEQRVQTPATMGLFLDRGKRDGIARQLVAPQPVPDEVRLDLPMPGSLLYQPPVLPSPKASRGRRKPAGGSGVTRKKANGRVAVQGK